MHSILLYDNNIGLNVTSFTHYPWTKRTRLEVLHGVVVVLQEDDGVGGSQVQAQPAHVRRQQHDVDCRVRVEPLNLCNARWHPSSFARTFASDSLPQSYWGPWVCARRRSALYQELSRYESSDHSSQPLHTECRTCSCHRPSAGCRNPRAGPQFI